MGAAGALAPGTGLCKREDVETLFKSIVFSVKDYLLDKVSAGHFDELPGFIR